MNTSVKLKCTNFVTTDCLQKSVGTVLSNLAQDFGSFNFDLQTNTVAVGAGSTVNISTALPSGAYLFNTGSLNVSDLSNTQLQVARGGVWFLSFEWPLELLAGGASSVEILVGVNGGAPTNVCGGVSFFGIAIPTYGGGNCILNLPDNALLDFYFRNTSGVPITIERPTSLGGGASAIGTVTLLRLGN